ncbi:interleukin-13 receptor subunit alpha-1 isoform X3 [Meriones unguiculatus]|uniref:interleukin-13 receptor subunit alpha-1 isoform X3 n=1 Tax=Meriones unguiculatus TaxID=10047 RepID=UPI000B4F5E4C|nr:interleukin-13 receptor subunit alpha-1 isoform X3 [Meriones unguiculatus]
MARPARPARPCGLWALLLCAAVVAGTTTTAGLKSHQKRVGYPNSGHAIIAPMETSYLTDVQPPVTNLSVSVKDLCTIIWTWDPPEGASPNCSLRYFSYLGEQQDKKIGPETCRFKEIPLNEKICLQVGSQCSTNESEKPSPLVKKCILPPEGDPESAVTELQCIWHNLSYMKCSWLPGRNTSPDTNYTLYYWYRSLMKVLQCENIYREGQHNGCSFKLTIVDSSFEQQNIQIMVNDSAGKIRPYYKVVSLTSCVKPDPPHIKNLFFKNGALFVQWKNPQNFSSRCLSYEVEVNSTQTELQRPFYVEEDKCQNAEPDRNMEAASCFIVPGILPDAVYTVRVRVKTNKLCFDDNHLWSNWSEAASIGNDANSTFYITMLLIIPVIVAGAVIVLLLYLKRLKIIIFPPIPDPGKIFKEMFGDQNDDTMHWKKYDIYEKQSKEETDSVVLIENLKKVSQ